MTTSWTTVSQIPGVVEIYGAYLGEPLTSANQQLQTDTAANYTFCTRSWRLPELVFWAPASVTRIAIAQRLFGTAGVENASRGGGGQPRAKGAARHQRHQRYRSGEGVKVWRAVVCAPSLGHALSRSLSRSVAWLTMSSQERATAWLFPSVVRSGSVHRVPVVRRSTKSSFWVAVSECYHKNGYILCRKNTAFFRCAESSRPRPDRRSGRAEATRGRAETARCPKVLVKDGNGYREIVGHTYLDWSSWALEGRGGELPVRFLVTWPVGRCVVDTNLHRSGTERLSRPGPLHVPWGPGPHGCTIESRLRGLRWMGRAQPGAASKS